MRKEVKMFKNVLDTLLREHGTNANSLAKALKLPKSVVYGWKNGEREPNMEQLKQLSTYFNVSLEYLCETEEFQLPDGEQRLITMLRTTKSISNEAYVNMIENFNRNISFYLEISRTKGND